MQPDESLSPDLAGTICSVGNCLKPADIVATATVQLPVEVGAIDQDETLVLDVPICTDHAHLLRMGVSTFDFESFPGGT